MLRKGEGQSPDLGIGVANTMKIATKEAEHL